MKKLLTLGMTAALSVAACISAPAAGAQTLTDLLAIDQIVSKTIDNTDCKTVKSILTGIDAATPGVLLDATTTRSQLAKNLREIGSQDVSAAGTLALPAIRYSNKTADKALSCGIVKPDSAVNDPFGLSSKITDYAPLLQTLSSSAS